MKEYKNITASTIIFRKNKVLLLDRGDKKPFPHTLALPAGKVKQNETFQNAAIREVIEEVGINLENVYFSNSYYHNNMIMLAFVVKIDDEILPDNYFYKINTLEDNELAPNTLKACQDGYRQIKILEETANLVRINESLQLAKGYISNNILKFRRSFRPLKIKFASTFSINSSVIGTYVFP